MGAKREDTDQLKVDHLLASMGFIFPRTENELASFDKLYSCQEYNLTDYKINPIEIMIDSEHVVSTKIFNLESKRTTYFERAVLAAEIASQLYAEPTFGHVKLQKLMFLCENIQGMKLNYKYSKQAAGPYDNKFMHSIDNELKKQNWLEVKKEKSGLLTRYKFIPLKNFNGHKFYYNHYFSSHHEKIQWFIGTFKKQKTDKVELIATLYACWIELFQNKLEVNDNSLLRLLYTWHKQKEKYSEKEALNALHWMKDNGVMPKKSISE